MNDVSKLILPFIVLIIIIYSYFKKVDIYDSFIKGSREGINSSFNIFPYLLAMIFGINIMISSNILDFIYLLLKPLINLLDIPHPILPLYFLKPLSSSASLAYITSLFNSYQPDSLIGNIASTIYGSSDTTIYILALYFGSIKIKKTRHALLVGLMSDFIGISICILLYKYFF